MFKSPGDRKSQKHPLFNQYFDICSKGKQRGLRALSVRVQFIDIWDIRLGAGEDHDWTVGTVLRQQRMHEPEVTSPENLRNVLMNDTERKHYVIDADILEDSSTGQTGDPINNIKGNEHLSILFITILCDEKVYVSTLLCFYC